MCDMWNLLPSFRFQDKTKNSWDMRDCFEKVPGKYDMLKMDYKPKVRICATKTPNLPALNRQLTDTSFVLFQTPHFAVAGFKNQCLNGIMGLSI